VEGSAALAATQQAAPTEQLVVAAAPVLQLQMLQQLAPAFQNKES
jgi:hypothetical protein